MASGQSENTKHKDDDVSFETKSTKSEFLLVSGNTLSTVNSTYLSVCGGKSSTIRTDRALSQFSVRDLGSSYNYQDTESAGRSVLGDPGDGSNYVQFDEEEYASVSAQPMCSNCEIDGIQTQATHVCESCNPDRKYICYTCLQGHNRWASEHTVFSLSVYDESSLKGPDEEHQDKEIKRPAFENLIREQARPDVSNPDTENVKDLAEHNANTLNQGKSGMTNLPKIRIFKGFKITEDKECDSKKIVNSRFYKDALYTEITKDPRYTNPVRLSAGSLTKYGTYSVRTNTDTKRCIITGICRLDCGQLILADSENCRLKSLGADNLQIISSYKVDGHPSLICLIEGEKIAVLFGESIIKIIIIAKEIQLLNSFYVKGNCIGLTYGNGNLYVCLQDKIEIYSDIGEKRDSICPSSNEIRKKFVNFHKIIFNKDEDTLFIVDKDNGIVLTDTRGYVQRIISENIDQPNAICIDGSIYLYVTEVNSDRVLKISADDGKVIQVLKEVSKGEHPISLCHDRINNRLIVGVWCSDNIHVYSC